MLKGMVELLVDLIKIDSPTGQEGEIVKFLAKSITSLLRPNNLSLQEVDLGRYNLFATKNNPSVYLSSHLDTVPGRLKIRSSSGIVTGRGACDAKGQIASQIFAVREALNEGLESFGLIYVVGEEIDSIGVKKILEDRTVCGYALINGEPTQNHFAAGSFGITEFILKTRGSKRHSSLHPNSSALHKLIYDLNKVLALNDKDFRINIAKISSDAITNQTAAEAKAIVSIRSRFHDKQVVTKIKKSLKHSILVLKDSSAQATEFSVPVTETCGQKIWESFCSDASFYKKLFDHVLLFGPGSIEVAHSNNECISKAELYEGVSILKNVLLGLSRKECNLQNVISVL